MNNNQENDNYKFFDFPENIEIEIPDTPSRSSNNERERMLKDLAAISPEQLKKMMPPELLNELNNAASSTGMSADDILKQSIEMTQKFVSGDTNGVMGMLLNFGGLMDDSEEEAECDKCEKEEVQQDHYELADVKYLKPEYFGSVICYEDDNLYEHFTEKYGVDSTKYLDSNEGVKESYLTEITANLPFGNIKNLKFVEANNRFILFYAETNIENAYGFFVAMIKSENDFALYVPEFRNTFNIDPNGEVNLFNPIERPALFSIDVNNGASFDQLSIPSIEFAINFALAPKKKTLITPTQFGTIKNVMPPITGDSMFLKVGAITSNESSEAILLKKDAELDLRETVFPIYFNFNRVVSKQSLSEIAQILFKTDLNENNLMKNSELRYTSDHRLYIDVDLGDF